MNDRYLPTHFIEQLRVCETRLHAFLRSVPIPMALLSAEDVWAVVNDSLAARLGFGAEEIIGKPFLASVHEEDRGRVLAALHDLRARHSHVALRFRMLDKNLKPISFEGNGFCRREGDEPPFTCWLFDEKPWSMDRPDRPEAIDASAIAREIGEPVATTEELRRTAELLERMFAGLQVQLVYLDREFNYVRVNPAYAQAVGREPDDLVGKNHFVLFPDVEMETTFRRVVADGEPYFAEGRPYPKGKHQGYRDISLQPVVGSERRVEGLVLSLLDVTERVQARREAEQTATYTRSLIEAALDPLFTIGVDGRINDVNGAAELVTGYPRAELIGTDFRQYFSEPDQARAGYERAFSEGLVRDFPLEIRHKDGHLTSVLYNASIYRDESGNVKGVFAAARDISERKQADAEVQRLNRWNRLLLDSVGEGIYGIDLEGRCTFINPSAVRLLGFASAEELVGRQLHELVHHSRADGSPYPVSDCLVHRSGTGRSFRGSDELYWRKDGSSVPVEYVSTPITDESGSVVGAVVSFNDITDRKRAERLLDLRTREQEGIAHLGIRALSGESGESLMSAATRTIAEILGVEFCKVLELRPGGDELLLRAGVGWKEGSVGHAVVSSGLESQAGYTLFVGEPVVVRDLRHETRFSGSPLLHEHGIVSGMSVVIGGRTAPFGVLGAHAARQREFTRDDVNFLQAVANVIAAAVERTKAEEALRAAGAYNRRLIEASLDPLVTIGSDGKIEDVNAATEEITGLSRQQLIGTDFSEYFEEPDKARAGYEKVFREGFVRDYPLDLRRADGHITPVLYNASIYRDDAGNVAGIFAAARDITERKRSEEALRESAERLSQAQQIARLGSWELSLTSDRLDWSDEVFRIFEIDKAKFGASYEAFLSAIHPEDRASVDAAFSSSVKTRTPYSIEHRLLFADGRIKYVHERGETFYAEDDRPLRSVGTVQDITERKEAEEALRRSESRYRSLFERMFDGYAVHEIIVDAEGRPIDYRFLEVNPAFERMTGLRRDEVVGRRVREILPDLEELWIETYGSVAQTGKGRRFEQYAKAFDRHFEVAVFSPAPGQFATLFSDVTERRRAEEELHRLNRELEERVRERTAELEAANRELESFAYSVSHDLRTPLRAIDGFSRILLIEQEARLDEDGRRLLRIVRENTERMSQLINDILQFSRTGRAAMKEEPLAMGKLVEEVWAEIVQEQQGRHLELRLGDLPDACGDRALLRQVILNLLSNAAKFTRPRARAIIEVGAQAAEEESVYYVRDNGVGFDTTYADKLFGVFQRLHSGEEFEGTGIGLAIVKRIVNRHDGRVWAEGRVGEGATFYFSLPKHHEGCINSGSAGPEKPS